MEFVFQILWTCCLLGIVTANNDKRYLYFTGMDATYWQDAKDNCEKIDGKLAQHIAINDWEMRRLELEPFVDNLYWIGIKKHGEQWQWEDGTIVNTNDTQAFALRPDVVGQMAYLCILWNPLEPFLIPSDCSNKQPYVCEFQTGTECTTQAVAGFKINETGWTIIEKEIKQDLMALAPTPNTLYYLKQTAADQAACAGNCEGYTVTIDNTLNLECWLAEYNNTSCRLLLTDGAPVVDFEQDDSGVSLLGRYCFDITEYINTTCDCRCINITEPIIPATPEEFAAFVEEKQEEAKKELIVETKNLSSTVRKLAAAPDDRPSSTGMGYLGIAAISVVLGGLILADLTAMFGDVKIMIGNIKSGLGD